MGDFSDKTFSFTNPNTSYTYIMDFEEEFFTIIGEMQISPEFISEIKSNSREIIGYPNGKLDFPKQLQDELFKVLKFLEPEARCFSEILKYQLLLNLPIKIIGAKKKYLVENGKEWIVPSIFDATLSFQSFGKINSDSLDLLKKLIIEDFKPYIANQFIEFAKKSSNPQEKIILAAISSELAIKEFFCRINPDLQFLVEKMPSPPIRNLYGDIFKHYTGLSQKFPFIPFLVELSEHRNSLVHNPNDFEMSAQKVLDYIGIVSHTIEFLTNLQGLIFDGENLEMINQMLENLNKLKKDKRLRALFPLRAKRS